VLDSRRSRRSEDSRPGKERPEEGRSRNRQRNAGRTTAKRPASRTPSVPGARSASWDDDNLVVEVKTTVRTTRSDPEARRERMERRRRRMALQRQITFGLMGRRTDPDAVTTALPLLEQSKTGSIKVSSPRTDRIRMETPRSGSLTLHPSDPDNSTDTELGLDDGSARRGRRAGRPQGSRRRAELAIGRAVSNRRVWGGALAIALVLIVPSTSMLNRSSQTADSDLSSGGVAVRAAKEFPSYTEVPSPSLSQSQAAKTAQAKAKATAKTSKTGKSGKSSNKGAAPSATTKARNSQNKTTVRAPSNVHLAGLSDARSGLGWASGAYIPGSSPAKQAAFAAWRGTGVDVAVDWGARSSWDDIVNPTWLYDAWKGTTYTKSFGVAPIPEGDGSATMAGCAAGDYNDKWTQFGQNIKAAGLDTSTVIRLGWEFNGDWYKWQASNPSQFAECWRQIVGTVRKVAPSLVWDWNVNRGRGASVLDASDAYPGDSYVDIVGIDSYDMWPGVTSEAAWQQQYVGAYGLKFWVDFAKAHGKKVSVPEWGCYPGTAQAGHNGGDNPFYIQKMQAFFKSLGSQLAYESYFNEDASYYAGSLFGPDQNPAAAAKYKSLFGG
jgi:hypothetical protein